MIPRALQGLNRIHPPLYSAEWEWVGNTDCHRLTKIRLGQAQRTSSELVRGASVFYYKYSTQKDGSGEEASGMAAPF